MHFGEDDVYQIEMAEFELHTLTRRTREAKTLAEITLPGKFYNLKKKIDEDNHLIQKKEEENEHLKEIVRLISSNSKSRMTQQTKLQTKITPRVLINSDQLKIKNLQEYTIQIEICKQTVTKHTAKFESFNKVQTLRAKEEILTQLLTMKEEMENNISEITLKINEKKRLHTDNAKNFVLKMVLQEKEICRNKTKANELKQTLTTLESKNAILLVKFNEITLKYKEATSNIKMHSLDETEINIPLSHALTTIFKLPLLPFNFSNTSRNIGNVILLNDIRNSAKHSVESNTKIGIASKYHKIKTLRKRKKCIVNKDNIKYMHLAKKLKYKESTDIYTPADRKKITKTTKTAKPDTNIDNTDKSVIKKIIPVLKKVMCNLSASACDDGKYIQKSKKINKSKRTSKQQDFFGLASISNIKHSALGNKTDKTLMLNVNSNLVTLNDENLQIQPSKLQRFIDEKEPLPMENQISSIKKPLRSENIYTPKIKEVRVSSQVTHIKTPKVKMIENILIPPGPVIDSTSTHLQPAEKTNVSDMFFYNTKKVDKPIITNVEIKETSDKTPFNELFNMDLSFEDFGNNSKSSDDNSFFKFQDNNSNADMDGMALFEL